MAQLIALNCPNCGGAVSRDTLKCEYCGAELILAASGFAIRGSTTCFNCGGLVGQGSWFCPKCLAVLAKDEHPLKETQKRVIFQQERLRKLMPIEIASQVEPHEFVHY